MKWVGVGLNWLYGQDRMCKDMTVWSFVEIHMIWFVWSGECMSGWGMERDETKEDILWRGFCNTLAGWILSWKPWGNIEEF